MLPEGYGFLRTSGYLPGDNDVYVSMSQIRRFSLRRGDMINGQVRPPKDNEKYTALLKIDTVNGMDPETARAPPGLRGPHAGLPRRAPAPRAPPEHDTAARIIDLVCPIGKGQRGLIVSPPKAGKTTVLKDIAASITANNPEVHLMCLLVDERPEEVTDMERSIHRRGRLLAPSTCPARTTSRRRARDGARQAPRRERLRRRHPARLDHPSGARLQPRQPASGRILSGGVDSTALYPPKKFFGAARNIEYGGSLTILATALVDTGSKMDEVIFEEFKGTGNMELRLDRKLADRRIFPAIDIEMTGTRKEELLLEPAEAAAVWKLRGVLHSLEPAAAIELLIKKVRETKSNAEFLAALQKNSR